MNIFILLRCSVPSCWTNMAAWYTIAYHCAERVNDQFVFCFWGRFCSQISKLSEKVRSESELRGSQASLASTGKDKEGPKKGEPTTARPVIEEEKKSEKQPQEKDKLIQAETVETGRVNVLVKHICDALWGSWFCIILKGWSQSSFCQTIPLFIFAGICFSFQRYQLCSDDFWCIRFSSCKFRSSYTKTNDSKNKLRVPGEDGVSQVWYIVEIHHSGWKPSKLGCFDINCPDVDPLFLCYCCWTLCRLLSSFKVGDVIGWLWFCSMVCFCCWELDG